MEIYYQKPCCQVGPNVDIMIGTALVITQLALRMIFLYGQTKGRFGKRYLPKTESRLKTAQSAVLAGIESILQCDDDLQLPNTQCLPDDTVNKALDVIENFCPLGNDEYNESNQRWSYYQREEAGYGKEMPQQSKKKGSSLNLRKYESRQKVQTSNPLRYQRTGPCLSQPGTSGNQPMSVRGRPPSRIVKGRVGGKAKERGRPRPPVKTIGAVRMVHLHRDGIETGIDSNEPSTTTVVEAIPLTATKSSSTGRLVKASIAAAATQIAALSSRRTSVSTLPMSSSENESIRRLVRPTSAHRVYSPTKRKLSSALVAEEPILSNVKHKYDPVSVAKVPLPTESNKISTEEEEEETEKRSIIIHDKLELLDKKLTAPTTSTRMHGTVDTKRQPIALTISSSNEQRLRKSGMISAENINAKKSSFNENIKLGKESVLSYKPLQQYSSRDSNLRQSLQSAKSFMNVAQTDARLSTDKHVKESTSSVLEVTDNENKLLDKTSINHLPFSPRSDIALTPGSDSIEDRRTYFSNITDGTITPEVRAYHPQGGGGSLLPSDDVPYDQLVNGVLPVKRQNRFFYNKFYTTNDESTLKSPVESRESSSSSIDSDRNTVTVTQSAKSSLMYSHTGDSALTLTQTDESLLSFEGGSNSFFSVQESGLSAFSADQSNLTTERSCNRSFSLGNSGIYFRTGEAFDGEGIMKSTQNRKPYTTEERNFNEREIRKFNVPATKPGKTISSIDQRANVPDNNQFAHNRLNREEVSRYQQHSGFYFAPKTSQDHLLGVDSDRKSHIPRQPTPENDEYKQQRKVNELKHNNATTSENDEYKQQRKINEYKYNTTTTFETDVYKQQRKVNELKYNNTTTLENDEYKYQRKINEHKYNNTTTLENDDYKQQRKINETKYNSATTPSTSAGLNCEKNKSLKKTSKEKASDFEIDLKTKRDHINGFPSTTPGIPTDVGLRSNVLSPFSVPVDKISNNSQFDKKKEHLETTPSTVSNKSSARERGRHSFPESAPTPDKQTGRFSLPESSSKLQYSDSSIMGTRVGTYKEPFPKVNAERIEPNGTRPSSASTEPSFVRKDLHAVPGFIRTDSITSFRRNSVRPFPWIQSTTTNGLTGQTLQAATNSRVEPEANRNMIEVDRASGLEEQSSSRPEPEANSVQSSRVGLSFLNKLKPFLGRGSEIAQTGSGPVTLDSDVNRISPETTGLSTRVGLALLGATSIDPFPKRNGKSSSDSYSLSGTGSGSLVIDPEARRRYSTDREINRLNSRFSGLDLLSTSNIKLYFDARSKTSNSSNLSGTDNSDSKSLSTLVQSMGIYASVSGLKLPPSSNVSFSSKENGSSILPEVQSIETISNIFSPDSNQTSSLSGSHGSENEKHSSKRISKKQKLKRIPISNLSIGSDTGLNPRDLSQIASIIVSSAGETFANRLESSIWTPSRIGLILDSQDQIVSSETSIRTGQEISEGRLFQPEDYGLLNQEALVPVRLRPERAVLGKYKSQSQTELALTTSLKTAEMQRDTKKKDRNIRDDESSTSKVSLRKTSIKQSKSATNAKKDDLTDEPSASKALDGKKIITKGKSDSVGNLYSDETQSEPSVGKSSGDESTSSRASSDKTIKARDKLDSSLKQNVSTKDVPESTSREPIPVKSVTGQNKSGSEGFLKRRLRSSLSFGLGFLFESTTFIPSVPPMRTLIQAPRTFFSNRRLNRRVVNAAGSTNQMETAVEETKKSPWMRTRICDSSDSDDSLF